jgi:1-deoxy-D-xylulose-5-phosphate synthase
VDPDCLDYCGKRAWKLICVLEDGDSGNGYGAVFGTKLAEYHCGTEVRSIGWPDRFIPHGSIGELRKAYGLDADSLCTRIRDEYMEIDRKR